MMFTTLSSTFAGMKAKVLAGTVVAGAALMLAAPAAQAQRLAFGVTVGGPVYAAPGPAVVYAGPGYYDGVYFRDHNGWRAHEMMLRERRFDRDHNYYPHDDRRFDHGRDGHYRR
jgi:hypothetical protein